MKHTHRKQLTVWLCSNRTTLFGHWLSKCWNFAGNGSLTGSAGSFSCLPDTHAYCPLPVCLTLMKRTLQPKHIPLLIVSNLRWIMRVVNFVTFLHTCFVEISCGPPNAEAVVEMVRFMVATAYIFVVVAGWAFCVSVEWLSDMNMFIIWIITLGAVAAATFVSMVPFRNYISTNQCYLVLTVVSRQVIT